MHPPLRSFGRIKARTLKPRQAALLETALPRFAIPPEGALEPDALFGETARGGPLILEIGFGGGEHLAAQASAWPAARFLGVEPFLNGVASALRHIEGAGLDNVRLHQGDARDVIDRLPEASVTRAYILFPDPWPKQRHWKRRLIQKPFIAALRRIVKPGGVVRFATDWAHYAAWTLEMFHTEPGFEWRAACAQDWRAPWAGHVATRYELKRLGDCAPVFLEFERIA